jgi:molecular chaperone GrpE
MHDESHPGATSLDETLVATAESPTQAVATETSPGVGDEADPLAAAQAEVARLRDLWLRSVADSDNLRKRTRREVEDATRTAREGILRTLLPVFDNLERAIESAGRSTDVKAIAEGLAMVQRQLVAALEREGIERVPTVGRPFDPTIHEAIQHVETADHAPGMVLAEVQPGYRQGERLVRAALVIVAKAPSGGAQSGGVTS